MNRLFKIAILQVFLAFGFDAGAADMLRLVTTTSTDNSGLTDYLVSAFKSTSGINVHVVAVGTGKALAIARNGDADVILVHSKPDELEFIEQGYGVERIGVMYNDFILVGPKAISEASSIADVFETIAARELLFISRGDDSGTHKKELALWESAAVASKGVWYRESGQGMGKTLQIASELDAYTLTDRGTWLAQNANQRLRLEIVFEGDENLFNPYSLIAVNPARFPHVNADAANQFIDWITSEQGQRLIAEFDVEGQQLFFPSANR